ncbi:hypothetical protein [Flavobacterium daemonense]|uniref:hypothetical protein n=1 Tax=Flavobacterium daemonense TaxID=1393049 RepID=UPI0013A627C3|nr:hypothetical protein [Flavobacterium daemonense]KAF2336323.1 hypothetical protein FND99_03310 [Flavobacterium daemonense]
MSNEKENSSNGSQQNGGQSSGNTQSQRGELKSNTLPTYQTPPPPPPKDKK